MSKITITVEYKGKKMKKEYEEDDITFNDPEALVFDQHIMFSKILKLTK